jgi:hypothetical protein
MCLLDINTNLSLVLFSFSVDTIGECPSVYELKAWPHFNWSTPPELRLWRKSLEENGKENMLMEAYGPKDHIEIMLTAFEENKVRFISQTVFSMKCLIRKAQLAQAKMIESLVVSNKPQKSIGVIAMCDL